MAHPDGPRCLQLGLHLQTGRSALRPLGLGLFGKMRLGDVGGTGSHGETAAASPQSSGAQWAQPGLAGVNRAVVAAPTPSSIRTVKVRGKPVPLAAAVHAWASKYGLIVVTLRSTSHGLRRERADRHVQPT